MSVDHHKAPGLPIATGEGSPGLCFPEQGRAFGFGKNHPRRPLGDCGIFPENLARKSPDHIRL